MKQQLKNYAVITAGSVIFGLSFDMFFVSNQITMGGVTGLAQVINALIPQLSVGLLTFLLNVPLFAVGWKAMGFHLLASSLFSMAVSSLTIDAVAAVYTFPPMDSMLAAVCGGAMMGVGLGLVFAKGATTGGTDIVARLLKLKFPWLPMGKLILIPDCFVLALAAITFDQIETALYGVIALVASAKVMDLVLYGLDTSKVAYIISDRWRRIADGLLAQDRGVTILQGRGAYTNAEKQVLMVAFKDKEIVEVKRIVHETDPEAFLIVCDAHDVLGEGFGEYQENAI